MYLVECFAFCFASDLHISLGEKNLQPQTLTRVSCQLCVSLAGRPWLYLVPWPEAAVLVSGSTACLGMCMTLSYHCLTPQHDCISPCPVSSALLTSYGYLNTCNLRAPLPWLLSDSSQGCPQAKTLLSRRFLVVLQVSQSCCPGTRTYCSGYLVYKLLVITACSQKLVLDDKVQSQMLSLFWLHQYQNFLSFPYHESGAKKYIS